MNGPAERPLPADTARLFVALWPDEAFRRALQAWCGAVTGATGSRPVTARRWHLTLHFLGDVPGERVPELRRALRVPFQAFRLGFSRFERWPHGLIVLPADALPPALADLHGALGDALRSAGLPCEARSFRPHLTVARRYLGALPQPVAQALVWDVDACALVESRARVGGGYTALESWPPT